MKTPLAFLLCMAMSDSALLAQLPPPPAGNNSLMEFSGDIWSLSRKVSPAVVQVSVSGYSSLDQSTGHSVSLFGRQESLGSGVIVDTDGYIVTNAHVVSGAVRKKCLSPARGRETMPQAIRAKWRAPTQTSSAWITAPLFAISGRRVRGNDFLNASCG